jgi:hypothetical protein
LQEFAMDVANDLRTAEREQIVVAFEIAMPVPKPFATEFILAQGMALDHRAHRAIEQQYALLQCRV